MVFGQFLADFSESLQGFKNVGSPDYQTLGSRIGF